MTTPLLTTLRQHLKARGIDALYVPTADPHQSEYVGEHYQTRAFLTGFTGSAGTAVVTAEHALLWTDGRYFIQAERQIKDRGFSLMRLNTPGFPSVTDWLCTHMPAGGTLAFNGRTLSRAQYDELSRALDAKGVRLLADDTVLDLTRYRFEGQRLEHERPRLDSAERGHDGPGRDQHGRPEQKALVPSAGRVQRVGTPVKPLGWVFSHDSMRARKEG